MDKNILKIRYDPEIGLYLDKHNCTGIMIGEELMDIFELIGSKLFNKTVKKLAEKAAAGDIHITITDS